VNHLHHQLHVLPIIVSAICVWLLGALWYSPVLFAKPWVAIIGRKMGEKPKGVVTGMVGSLIGDILLAFVLLHFILWSGADSFGWGAMVGFITWVGYVVGPLYPQSVYEGRPFKYFAINAGYWLISLVGVGGLLAVWH
jgi:hypothetical protein